MMDFALMMKIARVAEGDIPLAMAHAIKTLAQAASGRRLWTISHSDEWEVFEASYSKGCLSVFYADLVYSASCRVDYHDHGEMVIEGETSGGHHYRVLCYEDEIFVETEDTELGHTFWPNLLGALGLTGIRIRLPHYFTPLLEEEAV